MKLEDLRSYYHYNTWANSRFFGALVTLDPARLTMPVVSSFPSALETVAHIVGAEWVWLRRWQGRSPTSSPHWLQDSTLQDLRSRLSTVELERADLLQNLTDDDLESELNYRNLNGESFTIRLLDQLLHVVNHSSYHRGQLTTMLRQLGATPVATDYVLYIRMQREST